MRSFFIFSLSLLSLSALAASSQENRANKNFEFTLQAGPDYRMSPTQLAAMYFINSDNLIGLKAGDDRTGREHQTNLAVQFQHYAGNSFYVAGEAFYLNTTEDIDGFWADIFNIEREYARYSSLGVGVRIGNQWTWKHFTLGCDWIGIGRRVGTFRKETDKLIDGTYTLLNVKFGASF
jgi:hypothetical protein